MTGRIANYLAPSPLEVAWVEAHKSTCAFLGIAAAVLFLVYGFVDSVIEPGSVARTWPWRAFGALPCLGVLYLLRTRRRRQSVPLYAALCSVNATVVVSVIFLVVLQRVEWGIAAQLQVSMAIAVFAVARSVTRVASAAQLLSFNLGLWYLHAPAEHFALANLYLGGAVFLLLTFSETAHAAFARRMQDEAVLRQFSTIVQSSSDAIISKTPAGIVSSWNPAAEALFGYAADEIVGRPVMLLIPECRRDEEQIILDKILRGERLHNYESRRLRKDGSVFEASLTISPILDTDGTIVGASKICRDITEQKRVERDLANYRERLEAMVEERTAALASANRQLSDTQFAMDCVGIGIQWAEESTGRFIYVNRYFASLLEYSTEEMLQLGVPDIDPSMTPERFVQRVQQLRDDGRLRLETTAKTKSGRFIPVEVVIYHRAGENGEPGQFISFLTDITEREESRQELIRTKEAAENASLSKSIFLSNMSHEIRTPLNGVLGLTHVLRRTGVTPRQAELLDKMETSGRHLLGIINSILDLSKIEAGRLTLDVEDFALPDLVRDVAAITHEDIQKRGLRFEVRIEGAPKVLRGDRSRLAQALVNYIGNATKFTEHGSIVLRCRTLEETAEGYLLRFEVADTGIGIPPEVMARLFADFEQADNSATRRFQGTGLGLSLTRRLAALMGGETGAESEPGKGSTFWFTVRLGRSHAIPGAARVSAEAAEARLRRRCAGKRVLVVEDNEFNWEVVRELLADTGLAIDRAMNGRVAVERARAATYDLVLMDMQMPEMSGVEATREIRCLPAHARTPIVAMTANAFVEDRETCLRAGMNAHLAKPLDPALFYETIDYWLAAD